MKKRIALLLALALAVCGLAGCGRKGAPFEDVPDPIATILLSDGRSMEFDLFVQEAPNTVANFVELANDGFYDGMSFFRIIPGILIQSGDPYNNGKGHADHVIQGEFADNGIENSVSHLRGTISMARQSGYDTASSQFFILHGSFPEYNGSYAAFGRIRDEASLDVLDSIASTSVDANHSPVNAVPTIASIRVETYGYEYEAAKMLYPDTTPTPEPEEEEEEIITILGG